MIYTTERDFELETNLAFDYAFYMMFTSYFKKGKGTPDSIIERLVLNYAEIGYNKQYEAEDPIIKKIEEEILTLPDFANIDNLEVEDKIEFLENEKRCLHKICFDTKIYIFKVIPIKTKKELDVEIEMERIQ